MMAATLDQYKIEELETSLLIQKDENDAIKAALKVNLTSKSIFQVKFIYDLKVNIGGERRRFEIIC